MSTIEIQEPEVKPAKPASRQMAAILPSSDTIWGPALPPKTMFSDSLEPPYPALARAARVRGDVVLSAVIDTDGHITNLQLVRGHPMLVPAAIAAVKQWRYKPYLLNGQPVEVETTITVIFTLSS
jgi:TonB family protein